MWPMPSEVDLGGVLDWLHLFIGRNGHQIAWWQMSIRAVLLFAIAVGLVRIGGDRIFGKNSALDIVLGVILGSNISRALTGSAPFEATVISTTILVGLHAVIAYLAVHSSILSKTVKGRSRQLVEDGDLQPDVMRRSGIGTGDLREALRLHGYPPDISQIQHAYLERSGEISVVTYS